MQPAIPKVINFFWANEKMSWLRYLSIWTAKKFNPNWTVRLYLHAPEEEYGISEGPWAHQNIVQDFFNYEGENFLEKLRDIDVEIINWQPKYFTKTLSGISEAMRLNEPLVPEDSTPSHRSNYFKWYLMATEGGFYADNDILFVRSMDELYDKYKDADDLISYHDMDKYFSIGLLASRGGSTFYRDVYIEALKVFDRSNYQQAGVVALNLSLGNHSLVGAWPAVRRKYPEMKIRNIGMGAFYPYDCSEVECYFESDPGPLSDKLVGKAVGLHWYAGHPTAQKWNNLLGPDNYKSYNNVITRELKKMLGGELPALESDRQFRESM